MATVRDEPSQKLNPGGVDIPEDPPKSKGRVLIVGIVAVAVVIALVVAVRFFLWSANHVSTDDAQISADIIQIAPQVGGTVTKLTVDDNSLVKPGQLLVQIDDTDYVTAVENAQANLELALAQARGAKVSVDLTDATGRAQVEQAQGGLAQAQGGVGAALSDVTRALAATAAARAQAGSASANQSAAQSALELAISGRDRAKDALTASQAALDSARAGVRTASANLAASKAAAGKAEREAKRQETLFAEGASSGQLADQARSAADVAAAQARATEEQVHAAEALVAQRQADIRSARDQMVSAEASIRQARDQLRAAQAQFQVATEGIRQSEALANSSRESVAIARAKAQQATGQLNQAETTPEQVGVSKASHSQANAKVEQARAQLRAAQINLKRTRIEAPVAGRVSRRTISLGSLATVGTPVMYLVREDDLWVEANFKETQLADVRVGQDAEVEVDAFPGRVFRGHVESISAGTGATFALLPPDNATGNFTKVVQRVPVKIRLDPKQPDVDRLRVGMSITATIRTK